MRLSVEVSENLERRLSEEAKRLGVSVEELARAFLQDSLGQPDDDFRRAADRVLRKNEELYRRLA